MGDYTGADNLEVMKEAENYNRYLLRLVQTPARKDWTLVDFGAGAGTFALPLHDAGYRVTCVEPDKALSETLRRQGLTVVAGLDGIADASIDYLYSLNVLEHIADDVAVLRAWWAKLRPGGVLLVYVPAFGALFTSMDRKVGHLRRYRRKELEGKLTAAGFQVTESRYVDSLGFFATLAFRLLDDGSGDIDVRKLRLYDRWVFPVSRVLDRITYAVLGKNVLIRARR